MAISTSELNFDKAVDYHYKKFPPKNIDYHRLLKPLGEASVSNVSACVSDLGLG